MKILYVSTISNTINAFMIPHIELLLDQGHHVDIACNINKEISEKLTKRGCEVFNIEFQRSPLTKENFLAYKKIQKLIIDGGYHIVHTHTPVASTIVRFACRKLNHIKVLYTAHGFHFFTGAPLKNWLIYYPVEWYLAKYTDVLITVNNEDYNRAKRSLKVSSVEYMPGVGLDTQKYSSTVVLDKSVKRKEIGVPENAFVILSVGELNGNKNHEVVVRTVAKLNNPNIFYVICGQGPLEGYLKNLSDELGIGNQVKLLGYRRDIANICKLADIFAFPSKREGLGIAALEAMAAGLPIITSNMHGIVDYSINGVTGYSCSPLDIEGFLKGVVKLESNPYLSKEIGEHNIEFVKQFDIENSLTALEKIYKEELNEGYKS